MRFPGVRFSTRSFGMRFPGRFSGVRFPGRLGLDDIDRHERCE